jgi:hypothetical protein
LTTALCICALAWSVTARGSQLGEEPIVSPAAPILEDEVNLDAPVDNSDGGIDDAINLGAPVETSDEGAEPLAEDPFEDDPYTYTERPGQYTERPGHCDNLWVRVDYLHWWLQGYSVPPLATSVPVGGGRGTITNPNTTILLGNERLDGDGRSGVRVNFGYRLGCLWSVEADFFTLEQGGANRQFSATPGTRLFRPFFNAAPGVNAQRAEEADTIDVSSSSNVYSPGVLFRRNICCEYDPCRLHGYKVDVLGGYRHYRLSESLTVQETASVPGFPVPFDLLDRFETDNHFHGAELGLAMECYHGSWALEGLAKVALGNVREEVRVSGRSIPALPLREGGLLAQPTNIGTFSDDNFSAIPHLELRLRRQCTERLSIGLGYTFIFFGHLVRPGDQIDFAVDGRWLDPNLVPPFVPPATKPARKFVRSEAWLQGLDLTLIWNY